MLIRAMGAFFVRRRSGNPLYRKVLERYIDMATREGVCQAVFPEGGLSKDGRLQKPKLGLIDYMLRGFSRKSDRDIVFIPVGINYDRTLEDRSLLRARDRDAVRRSWWFILWTTSRFIVRSLVLMVLSRWRRYGYACVNFGTPLSVKSYCRETGTDFSALEKDRRFVEIEKLSNRLMAGIARVVPVLPVSLVSTVFLEAVSGGMDILEIEKRGNQVIDELKAEGAPIFEVPRSTRARTIADAVEFLRMRRLISVSGRLFKVVPEEQATFRYYANSIGHWRK
jgi:glycerol-3-phosphate O-acyltransferase